VLIAFDSAKSTQIHGCRYGYDARQAAVVPDAVLAWGLAQTALSAALWFFVPARAARKVCIVLSSLAMRTCPKAGRSSGTGRKPCGLPSALVWLYRILTGVNARLADKSMR